MALNLFTLEASKFAAQCKRQPFQENLLPNNMKGCRAK